MSVLDHSALYFSVAFLEHAVIHRVSEKNKQNYFKLSPNLTIFGTKMAKSLKLHEMHSFSTSPNSIMSMHYRVKRRCSKFSHNSKNDKGYIT